MGLAERIDALEPREKRMVGLLAGVVGILSLLLVPVAVSSLLSEKTQRNELLNLALKRLKEESGQLRHTEAQRKALLRRYKKPAPALAGFLDKTATAVKLEIPEIKDRSPIAHGKKYEERSTSISFRKVGLADLVKFMEKVSGSSSPIGIDRLNIRKRRVEPDSYDAQLVVSAYHRLASEAKPDAKKGDAP